MENQNIQYRKLRDPKRAKLGHFSVSLLGKHSLDQKPPQQHRPYVDTIMSRNVIEYEHLLKNPLLHLKEVDWVSKLREPFVPKQLQPDEVQLLAPSVFSKTTEARLHHLQKNTSKKRGFNTADFEQLLGRRKVSNRIESGGLWYMTNLRAYPEETPAPKSKEKEKKQEQWQKSPFSVIPFKQRNQFPKFVTKQALRKAKIQKNDELQSAFDGSQNFPPYSEKIVKEKNYAILCTFTSGNERVSLPGLAWQMGLRS